MKEPDPKASAAAPDASFRALFDDALVGMGVADMQGNLLAFNDAMLAPGGYTREDIRALGNVARLYAFPEDRERVLRLVREQGHVWREEVQFVAKDGSPYDTLLTLTPVHFMGQPCLQATVEDITEQKRLAAQRRELEARLFKAQKMEAVGQMTAGIAHDFNNLLAIVRASCEMLELSLPELGAESRQHLGDVRDAAERGGAMIQKLLGYSRTADLALESVDLAALVEDMRSKLRALTTSSVTLAIEADQGTLAHCDRAAVEEMILNLVTNARDAMPGGGTLSLHVAPWVARADDATRPPWLPCGSYARVAVSDTGCGMDEETRARAMEPFFTTKPPGAGTGLGLPMVFGLAKQQGGFLELVSGEGAGTTVVIYLPSATD